MQRMPVIDRDLMCFALGQIKDACGVCLQKRRCIETYKYLNKLKTLDEFINTFGTKNDKKIDTDTACKFFVNEFKKVGGNLNIYMLRKSKHWQASMLKVVEVCNGSDIDPRLYLRAQIETIGTWAVKNKKPFYYTMVLGKNAQTRFEEWLVRNQRKNADSHYLETEDKHKDKQILIAESMFIEYYFESSVTLKQASTSVRKKYPYWSLRLGRENPTIRVQALTSYLASLNFTYPLRICLSNEKFKWGKLKKEILKILI